MGLGIFSGPETIHLNPSYKIPLKTIFISGRYSPISTKVMVQPVLFSHINSEPIYALNYPDLSQLGVKLSVSTRYLSPTIQGRSNRGQIRKRSDLLRYKFRSLPEVFGRRENRGISGLCKTHKFSLNFRFIRIVVIAAPIIIPIINPKSYTLLCFLKWNWRHTLYHPKPSKDSYKYCRSCDKRTYHSQNKSGTVHEADGV